MIYGISSAALLLLLFAVAVYRRRGKKRTVRGNVTSMEEHRKRKRAAAEAPETKQRAAKCSYCRKTVKRLTFYADENGSVIGVCPSCKGRALDRDLMPL
ncbi:hypothetical protein [Paenibacillus ginsengarvi]|uniref:Uncharacterized protein n=1 Tax=Paenibacillus ginsengarvi TaxID=400777 RepID=A0A3B0CJ92_9BACL|nr:hypothetical protein [Paenibacillus ginsengarvi]RKN84387.1 hypothetical protein D7M11_12915 [Paenibacillus ginsengarvi]